jgi:hypothetical protein
MHQEMSVSHGQQLSAQRTNLLVPLDKKQHRDSAVFCCEQLGSGAI